MQAPLDIAVVGAGPVGLALALHAAQALPHARLTVYDARPIELDVARDPRTLALALGSVQLLQRLGAWDAQRAQPIRTVHVSQQPPGERVVVIRADDEGVPMLGAVLAHGRVVAPLQAAWLDAAARDSDRLRTRFGAPVTALRSLAGAARIEVEAGASEAHDLVVVAEGGVYDPRGTASLAPRAALRRDYAQTAWVGGVRLADAPADTAWERFTRHGPLALLPLPGEPGDDPAQRRAALVWCVPREDDPVRELSDAQRLAVLNAQLHRDAGRVVALSGALKAFALGLSVQPLLAAGRVVRVGNAAQMLHPVAGQGLNLGLRDAFMLVESLVRTRGDVDAALRRVERARAPDRWSMILATDFLARSFTWTLPGAATLRGFGLGALQAIGPARSLLARQMMFGTR